MKSEQSRATLLKLIELDLELAIECFVVPQAE
jgi:hypothetical protein